MPAASDVTGFVASALVLLTFAMKDMRLLRIIAIFSNVAFIAYATMHSLLPILGLHLLLLPINLFRLLDVKAQTKRHGQRSPVAAADKATRMAIEAVNLSVSTRSKLRT
jgi:hypothetical protein